MSYDRCLECKKILAPGEKEFCLECEEGFESLKAPVPTKEKFKNKNKHKDSKNRNAERWS